MTSRPLPPVSPYRVEVFYDGDCPLCRREIALIRRMDRRGRIRFTDIAAEGFSAARYGKTHGELMEEIHGRDAQGRWITGVEVFRQLYGAVGLGPLAWLSRAPGVSQVLDWGYRVFAKQRLRLTGRRCDAACDSACGVAPDGADEGSKTRLSGHRSCKADAVPSD
ncbi:DUF393 domain-containing protein [Botrimarina sp.]|uniref:thiol-disulfide oxidoreductase DCC family protein n=1 Tax=Botrimarina sp. TaxID=2795802 RepID=UPI0032EDF94E